MTPQHDRLSLLRPPYLQLEPLPADEPAVRLVAGPGSALVWTVGTNSSQRLVAAVQSRPGGVGLILVLPEPERMPDTVRLLRIVEVVRPLAVLPYFEGSEAEELAQVLRRPPSDPAVEVTEYLRWRGLCPDRETTRLLRRTVELSTELRSVAALSRSLYLSRRALGRRFLRRGLPVPSHWLHFSRLLRVLFRLQNSTDSILTIGYRYGYPDGFSLSNQMVRLTGVRPSEARSCLGWEWFMEAWLRVEAESGALAPSAIGDDNLLDAPRPAPWMGRQPVIRSVEEVARRAG